jgi:hypothetical protein
MISFEYFLRHISFEIFSLIETKYMMKISTERSKESLVSRLEKKTFNLQIGRPVNTVLRMNKRQKKLLRQMNDKHNRVHAFICSNREREWH